MGSASYKASPTCVILYQWREGKAEERGTGRGCQFAGMQVRNHSGITVSREGRRELQKAPGRWSHVDIGQIERGESRTQDRTRVSPLVPLNLNLN